MSLLGENLRQLCPETQRGLLCRELNRLEHQQWLSFDEELMVSKLRYELDEMDIRQMYEGKQQNSQYTAPSLSNYSVSVDSVDLPQLCDFNVGLLTPSRNAFKQEYELDFNSKFPPNYCYVCRKVHSKAQLKLIGYKVKLYKSLLPIDPLHDMSRFDGMHVCCALKEIKLLLHKK